MRNRGLYHVGIAVKGLAESLPVWCDTLGLALCEHEDLPDRGLEVAILDAGGAGIELLESVSDDSAIGRYIAKRGPGVHHLAFEVSDIDAALAELKQRGVKLVDEVARPGASHCRVAFLHPAAAGGVLVELVERPARPAATGALRCAAIHAEYDMLANGPLRVGELPAWMNVRGRVVWSVHQGPYDGLGQAWAEFIRKVGAEYGARMSGPPGDVYVCDPADHADDTGRMTTILWSPIRG